MLRRKVDNPEEPESETGKRENASTELQDQAETTATDAVSEAAEPATEAPAEATPAGVPGSSTPEVEPGGILEEDVRDETIEVTEATPAPAAPASPGPVAKHSPEPQTLAERLTAQQQGFGQSAADSKELQKERRAASKLQRQADRAKRKADRRAAKEARRAQGREPLAAPGGDEPALRRAADGHVAARPERSSRQLPGQGHAVMNPRHRRLPSRQMRC